MNRLTLIAFGVLVLLIIILAVDNEYLRGKPVKTEIDKSLQIKIDSLSIINYALETRIAQYKTNIDSLSKARVIKEKKITNLKKSEDEKILAVDTLGSMELYNVFAGFTP